MFHLSIVTAEGSLYAGDIDMLVAPAVDGELGILTNHHPLVTKLGPGAMRVVKTDKTEEILFVNGGYLEVINNKATIIADAAENLEGIQAEQARAAREKAAEMLKHAKDDVDREKLEAELRAQMVRERLAEVNRFKKNKS
ncbi:MAG: ATP synthase F1 subunit epsilon [Candidatus Gracilibacteria bacterium]